MLGDHPYWKLLPNGQGSKTTKKLIEMATNTAQLEAQEFDMNEVESQAQPFSVAQLSRKLELPICLLSSSVLGVVIGIFSTHTCTLPFSRISQLSTQDQELFSR